MFQRSVEVGGGLRLGTILARRNVTRFPRITCPVREVYFSIKATRLALRRRRARLRLPSTSIRVQREDAGYPNEIAV